LFLDGTTDETSTVHVTSDIAISSLCLKNTTTVNNWRHENLLQGVPHNVHNVDAPTILQLLSN